MSEEITKFSPQHKLVDQCVILGDNRLIEYHMETQVHLIAVRALARRLDLTGKGIHVKTAGDHEALQAMWFGGNTVIQLVHGEMQLSVESKHANAKGFIVFDKDNIKWYKGYTTWYADVQRVCIQPEHYDAASDANVVQPNFNDYRAHYYLREQYVPAGRFSIQGYDHTTSLYAILIRTLREDIDGTINAVYVHKAGGFNGVRAMWFGDKTVSSIIGGRFESAASLLRANDRGFIIYAENKVVWVEEYKQWHDLAMKLADTSEQGTQPNEVPDEMPSDASGAMREKLNEIPYDLFPFEEVVPAYCAVAEYGAAKYDPWNWTKGLSRIQLLCSLSRHTWALLRGVTHDDGPKGSGLPHVYHVLWNACALVHNWHHNLEDGVRAEPPRDYKAGE